MAAEKIAMETGSRIDSFMESACEQLAEVAEEQSSKLDSVTTLWERLGETQVSLTEKLITQQEQQKQPGNATDNSTLERILFRIEELSQQVELLRGNSSGTSLPPIYNTNNAPPSLQPGQSHPLSYAMAASQQASSQLPPTHVTTMARSERRAREILIDGLSLADESGKILMEDALVEKCTQAVNIMRTSGFEIPESVEFLCARKVRNNGVVFELNSVESVRAVVGTSDNKEAFISALGTQVRVKGQTYPCIVEFVPVSFDPEFGGISKVETASHLSEGSISSTQWLKNPERQHDHQLVAHLVINFSTPEDANKSIRDGLIINGKKVKARIPDPDPIRCLKCHKFGHIAANCTADGDTCGHCAGQHRTEACTYKDDPAKRKCANCKETGHTAWD